MKIKIEKKLTPFSHLPGTSCIIPGTHVEVKAFPTHIEIGRGQVQLYFRMTGPVEGFTLLQDLEKNNVSIFGKAVEGFFHFILKGEKEGISFFVDRIFEGGVSYKGEIEGVLKRKDKLIFKMNTHFHLPLKQEKLSLGSHKKLDWDLVLRRFDLKEILPCLFLLGQKTTPVEPQEKKGTFRLLDLSLEKKMLKNSLEALCRCAFSKILVPRLKDEEYLGILPPEQVSGNRFFLLSQGYQKIRSLFFQSEGKEIFFLPHLIFDAGRMTNIWVENVGEFSFEWSKSRLKKVIFSARVSGEISIDFPKPLSSFRLRKSTKEKGVEVLKKEPFSVQEGKVYLFDNFKK